MYLIMSYIHFGVIEQQIQVYLLNDTQMTMVEAVYATLDKLEQTFVELAEKYQTSYIKIPNNEEIEEELAKKYNFIIFEE